MQTIIKGIGKHALEFLDENMFIFFGEVAFKGLEDYSILIQIPQMDQPIIPNQTLSICGEKYCITAVGNKVFETLSTLGHCTVRLDGALEAVLPGTLHIHGNKLPVFVVNGEITIL